VPDQTIEDVWALAELAAVEAGAVAPCPLHPRKMLAKGDGSARERAYAAGAALAPAGASAAAREDLNEVIDAIITRAPVECPRCLSIWFE
jgi:hypothetical protein